MIMAVAAVSTIALGLGAAPAAQAALPIIVGACDVSDLSPAAIDCAGWYDGNLLNNSGTHVADQQEALALLGFDWDGDWTAVDATKIAGGGGDYKTYDFPGLLDGLTYVGIHKGKGDDGFEGTAFFKLDADNLDVFTLNLKGGSDAVLYFTGGSVVPEPATWAMMIIGFGAAGSMLRSSRRRRALAAF
ncbi:MAG: PEPxxWA-CTERM sorting domain-containing protein [Phenylobacterium sp.]|nr:PEPxxWA-CTERM sorting domain-containing protein [Phenylobacterium sp.]MDP3870673.1 PEPxxWA-CTERM sorting domain-containing protein [Phenylobacterium sp.]